MADLQRWRYGYDLTKETSLASGTLYPILMRLSEQHLLEAAWEPPDVPGRPARHTYRLTPDGITLAENRLADRNLKAAPVGSRRSTRVATAGGAA